jgi:hypothetical protein
MDICTGNASMMSIHCNAGVTTTANFIGKLGSYGILSGFILMASQKQGCHVTYDSEEGGNCFMIHKSNGSGVHKFRESTHRLCYLVEVDKLVEQDENTSQ